MLVEQFNTILKKGKIEELIPFLKSLEKKEKKELAGALKPLAKEYLEHKIQISLTGTYSSKQKATPVQINILYAVAFTVYNRKDYQKLDSFGQFLSNSIIKDILPWYCPEWFSDFINDFTKGEWMPWNLDYKSVMDLTDKGYLNPSDELIARLIPQMLFERGANHKQNFVPQNL